MRYFLPILLFILAVISLATSCEPEIIEPPLPPPPPFSCDNGYEPNATQDSCVCPSPKVEIFGIQCYDIPPRTFYSDMEGCYLEAGIIYELEYDTSHYLSILNAFELNDVRYVRPSSSVAYRTSPVNRAFLFHRNSNWDSLRLIINAFPYYYSSFQHPDLMGPGVMEFRGIWIHSDTIEGHFLFGYFNELSSENWDLIELERCPATLVRY